MEAWTKKMNVIDDAVQAYHSFITSVNELLRNCRVVRSRARIA